MAGLPFTSLPFLLKQLSSLRSSGYCFFVASGNLCLCLRSPADAADHSTLVAIIAQRVRWQGYWGAGDSRWKVQLPASAGRQAEGSQRMCWCRTWISFLSDRWTTAGWKSSSMASHCSGERNWPWTPPWCLPLGATEQPRGSAPPAEQLWTKPGGGRSAPTPSWLSLTVAPGWWSWDARWEDVGPRRLANSSQDWRRAGNHEEVDDALLASAMEHSHGVHRSKGVLLVLAGTSVLFRS